MRRCSSAVPSSIHEPWIQRSPRALDRPDRKNFHGCKIRVLCRIHRYSASKKLHSDLQGITYVACCRCLNWVNTRYSGKIQCNIFIFSVVLFCRYIAVGQQENRHIYYYFATSERNPALDPVVVWINGGPACSGFSAFIHAIGINPCLPATYMSLHVISYLQYVFVKMIGHVPFLNQRSGLYCSYPRNLLQDHSK